MNYNIRKAVPGDMKDIIDLCTEHAAYELVPYEPEGNAERLSHILFAQHPRLFCLIAESENKVIGYATYAFEASTWDAAFYINMDCLYLRSHYRGFGIGEELMKHIARHGKENNCCLMQWMTPPFNVRAIKFYYRLGATSRDKTKFYLNEETIKNLLS